MQTNNKLREALVKCREIALQWQADEAAGVGTAKEQSARYNKYCFTQRSYEKGCGDFDVIVPFP